MPDREYRILVPLDGSPVSEGVLAAVMPLARSRAVGLTLLRVVEKSEDGPAARFYLAKVIKALGRHDLHVESQVEIGSPEGLIWSVAVDQKFDLVAMTTHGRSGFSHLVLGSVAESVLRKARFPVILNRPGSRIGDWKNIVVALDGSPESESILPEILQLARTIGATLHLVRVAEMHPAFVGIQGMPVAIPPEDPTPYLQGVARRLEGHGIPTLIAGLTGGASYGITEYAEDIGAGLICMTTHGRTGLARLLMGSVAEQVIRRAPCPVMIRRLGTP